MTIAHKVTGEFAQTVTCQLDADQTLFADASKFRWKTTNVVLETRLSDPALARNARSEATQPAGGRLKAALTTATEVGKRAIAGQSLAFQWFSPLGGSGLVAFAGDLPGQMRVIELDGSTGWRTESRAFVCAEASVNYDIDFSGFNLGRRSREGLVFEHFTGSGTLIVGGGGNLLEVNPARYGGKLQVHGGAVVALADAVDFGVERVGALNGPGLMNAMFGGQGLNMVTLSGDGPVILQSMLHREFEMDQRHDEGASNPLRGTILGGI